jgi:hypothetical protein
MRGRISRLKAERVMEDELEAERVNDPPHLRDLRGLSS